MKKLHAHTLLSLALALGAGCVTSYAAKPPLEFADVPYVGLNGQAWPERTLELPGVAKTYAMTATPRVTFVELNPEGERAMIFVHGLGSYLKFWRYQLDAFAQDGWHVVAIDMVGYGKSSKEGSFPYTMEAMADVVREVSQSLQLDKPVLVGHSMGGQTSSSYAIRYPSEVSALVLTAPAGFETFSRAEQAWFKSVFTTTLVKGQTEPGIWVSVRRNNFFTWKDDYEWLIEERVRLAQASTFDQYAYAQVKSVQGLTETAFIRANVDKIEVPVLVIHGDQDRLIPNPFLHGGESRDLMKAATDKMKDGTLVTLEDCGHMVQMDCAEAYNREVKRWLAPRRR